MAPHHILIDGTNVAYRAYHAQCARVGAEQVAIPAVVALGAAMLGRLAAPAGGGPAPVVLIAFDGGGDSGRRRIYPGYKANRPPHNAAIGHAVNALIAMFGRLAHRVYQHHFYEADDVIAALATTIEDRDPAATVTIASGDRDLLQLVTARTGVELLGRTIRDVRRIDAAAFRAEYGFAPHLLADYKALAGDPSDNIPGVPGIGPLTARRLVAAHGGIDALYGDLAAVAGAALRRKLADHEAEVRLYLKLTTAIRAIPRLDCPRAA